MGRRKKAHTPDAEPSMLEKSLQKATPVRQKKSTYEDLDSIVQKMNPYLRGQKQPTEKPQNGFKKNKILPNNDPIAGRNGLKAIKHYIFRLDEKLKDWTKQGTYPSDNRETYETILTALSLISKLVSDTQTETRKMLAFIRSEEEHRKSL